MSNNPKRMDQETTKAAGRYLFELPTDDSQAMDMRTQIKGKEMMKLLMYYGGMSQIFGSSDAAKIKDLMERLLISDNGLGRLQAVETLKQNFPKRVEVDKGSDGSFNDDE